MKAIELYHDHGTYAKLVPDANSRSMLAGLQKHFSVPNPVVADKLHMTVIYSRKPCPAASELQDSFAPIGGKVVALKYLPSQTGTQCLVAEVDSADAVNLHHHIRATYGASHDYPSYLAHITLSYDCPSSIRSIQEPIDIGFDQLLVSALDPNRQAKDNDRTE